MRSSFLCDGGRRAGSGGLAAVLLLAASAACSSGGKAPAPALQAVSVSPAGTSYLAVTESRQLQASGRYADGSSAAIASGLTWSSSDAAVATVSASGLVTAVGAGSATITARHDASGLSGEAGLTARVVTAVTFGAVALPLAVQVDLSQAYYRLSGLTPGAFYRVDLEGLADDVDLEVHSDLGLSEEALLCSSLQVGTASEACAAPASAAGELYVTLDGQWTEAGSPAALNVGAAVPIPVQGVLAYPASATVSGSVGTGIVFYRVTGLTPGASYQLRLDQLTDDVDLEVYGDPYEFVQLCSSCSSGTAADACTAAANAAGELLVEVDGENTTAGSAFRLQVAAAP